MQRACAIACAVHNVSWQTWSVLELFGTTASQTWDSPLPVGTGVMADGVMSAVKP